MIESPLLDYVQKTTAALAGNPDALAVRSFDFVYQDIPVQTLVAAGTDAEAFIGVINVMLGAISADQEKAFDIIEQLRDMVAQDLVDQGEQLAS